MYRDDRDAMMQRLDSLNKQSEALTRDNAAMREQLLASQRGVNYMQQLIYHRDVNALAPGERAALSHHAIREFPVWAVGVLSVVTLGLFPLIHFGLMHDQLPRAAHNDPSAGKAIGFSFIPFYAWYWMFFNPLRLADRLNLQLRLRGERDAAPKGLIIASSVLSVHPYLFVLFGWILWTITNCFLQSAVNKVARLPPVGGDPRQPALDPYGQPPIGLLPPG
jgi:hypothetical protein